MTTDNKTPMPKPGPKIPGGQTPFGRMTDLTRRLIKVPKSEVITKPKKALRKHR